MVHGPGRLNVSGDKGWGGWQGKGHRIWVSSLLAPIKGPGFVLGTRVRQAIPAVQGQSTGNWTPGSHFHPRKSGIGF